MNRDEYRYEHIETLTSPHAHLELSRKDSSFVTMHWHDALEIIHLLEGELTVKIESKEMSLHAGETVLINPGVVHSTISLHGNSAILLQIPAANIYGFLPDMRDNAFAWDPFTDDPEKKARMEAIAQLILQLRDTAAQLPPGYILHVDSLILELIFQLYTHFKQENSSSMIQRDAKNFARIAQVIDYTERHYREPISLNDVASSLHLQVNYFCRFFKENTQQTYLNYLSDYRLSKIHHDLLNTDDPINEIVSRHGFTNAKLFRQSFQKRFGMTPTEVRKANRESRSES